MIGTGYESWFNGADFGTMNEGEIAAAVLGGVADSLTHFVGEFHDHDGHEHE